MKSFRYTIISLAAALTLVSCDKEEVPRFNTDISAINIGFGSADNLQQTSSFNYSETSTERALKFYAKITGVPVDYDRTFKIEAVYGNIAEVGQSMRFDNYVIPANETSGEFNIYFDPSKLTDADVFAEEDGEIVLRTVANENFAEGTFNRNELHVTLKNSLSKPEYWDIFDYSIGAYPISMYFGTYSTEKFRFMLDQGCPINFRIIYSLSVPTEMDGDITNMSSTYAGYLKELYTVALEDYNATHDTPLCDGAGNPISFLY